MSTEQIIQNADIKGTFAPHVVLAPADITIISHSNVFYWWPAWSWVSSPPRSAICRAGTLRSPEIVERVHPSNNPGILFISIVVLLVVFTNTRLRGIYSVVTVVAAAFFQSCSRLARLVTISCGSFLIFRRARTSASTCCSRLLC